MLNFQPEQDIIASDADILVNTVNTVGVMGKGVARAFRSAFGEIMAPYEAACAAERLAPGTFQVLPTEDGRHVVNLATKQDWRDPSRYEWVGSGLVYLNRHLRERDPRPVSVCMPTPGAGNGGLDAGRVQQMVRTYLHETMREGIDVRLCAGREDPVDDPVFFAGVGSRKTPHAVLDLMRGIGSRLSEAGAHLRSGGAIGADTAFFEGAREANATGSEIFLAKPRKDLPEGIIPSSPVFDRMARNFHPRPASITPDPNNQNDRRWTVFRLMSRNGNQVFGPDFTNPSCGLICWTQEGKAGGGTGQAIRLARSVGIPVLDLGRPDLAGVSADDAADTAREMMREFRLSRGMPDPFPALSPDPTP